MTRVTFNRSSIASAISTALLVSMPAMSYAEEQASAETDEAQIERIQVTATHRLVAQEELPFNISSVLGSDIERNNIVDNTELLRNVAGITIIDRGHRNGALANSMVVRGINVDNGVAGANVGLSTAPTVATYVDSTPVFANFLLKDLQRVEVLRGPQGTLYGSGALGGTVRYIMNRPDADLTEGSFKFDIGQTDGSDGENMAFDGMFNMPITDKSAVRIVLSHIDNDGVIDHPLLYKLDDNGIPMVEADDGSCASPRDSGLTADEIVYNGACYESKDDVDTVEITYVKVAFGWEVTDNVNLLLTHHYQEDEIGGRRAVTRGADYLGNEYGEYDNGSTLLEPSERDMSLTSLELSADLGFATLTSNTSFYEHDGNGWRDNTGLWVSGGRDWYNAWYRGNPRPASHVEAGFDEEALVQELRLVSNNDGNDKIDWILGVYYMDQDRETNNFSHLRGLEEYGVACNELPDDAPCWSWWVGAPTDKDFTYIRKETFEDLAIYGELTYHLTDDLHLTAGARWFDNSLENETAINAYYGQPREIPFEDFPDQDEDDVLLKFNLAYDISDTLMTYATYSEGFRRGGSNAIPTDGPFAELNPETVETFEKDTVKNYELGLKGFGDWYSFSADIYFVDWEDPQLNTGTAWWAFFMAQNGESAETKGFEAEFNIAVSQNLNMHFGYSYTDAELSDDVIQPQTGGIVAESGASLPGVAENVFSASLNHTMQLTDEIEMLSNISAYYQSDTTNHISETSTIYDEFDSFTIFNASVQFLMDNWGLTVYAKNIGNEEGVTASYPDAYLSTDTGAFENYYGNNQKEYIATPRTIGAAISYKF
ncbi:TonB-dependent receptor [Thalassotalea sp. HSM 43]|uniref:TonB-dependent receptor n=1 Tax=Thalassotalea sp. HSM 43 TaxID=2552945 RepID=UPI0010815065|nr:TonB-dependent receptor [Thalassotalea sp. HSM 43]QBY04550.1 TonB-dependent receptor [Thalassotalea sp. HSM 43]